MAVRRLVRILALLALSAAVAAGCAPRVRPLVGLPYVDRLPPTPLPPGHSRLVFAWEYEDPFFGGRGEGVARIAPPDSVRLDFFVDAGVGGGYAVLIGDSLWTPANDETRRYLPPVQLLWGALGALRVNATDTIARIVGDTLFADIGSDPTWRAAFVGMLLRQVDRIQGNRLRERVQRDSITTVYRNFGARRRLTLTVVRRFQDPPFDEAIWRH